jgi:hypothetical protein
MRQTISSPLELEDVSPVRPAKSNSNIKKIIKMENFLSVMWIIVGLFAVILFFKLVLPKESFIFRVSLIVCIVGGLYFMASFISMIGKDDMSTMPIIGLAICIAYIAAGGKSVAIQTQAGVFSTVNNQPVGILKPGDLNWIDPIFEKTTVGATLSTKNLTISKSSTPDLQTKDRGIKAKVKNISFVVHLVEDRAAELIKVEGGLKTIKHAIDHCLDEILLIAVGKMFATNLDTDKHHSLKTLATEIRTGINEFCRKMKYPYTIVASTVILIGDTELEESYYMVLAKKAYAVLEAEAAKVENEALEERIKSMGKAIMPSGTDAEKRDAALVALKIVQRNINENKISISQDFGIVIKAIADILRKR